MEIAHTITYHPAVVFDDIPRLSTAEKNRVREAIELKLQTKPELFGKPLRQSLRGYRSLRVGDYRVVFRIEKKVVRILLIAHRSVVYHKAGTRT